MMRRLVALLAAIASLTIMVTPSLGASTYHIREQGSGLGASFRNFDWDEELPPGTYFETYIDASSYLAVGSEDYQDQYACVFHWSFTIGDGGEWLDDSSVGGCGTVDELAVGSRLDSGHVAGAIPVEDCLEWDEETGECLEVAEVGLIEFDLTFTGDGPINRWHGTNSGGIAGGYQYVSHGTGADRAAVPAGSLTLDGASLIDGATRTDGFLFRSRGGWVDIYHDGTLGA